MRTLLLVWGGERLRKVRKRPSRLNSRRGGGLGGLVSPKKAKGMKTSGGAGATEIYGRSAEKRGKVVALELVRTKGVGHE